MNIVKEEGERKICFNAFVIFFFFLETAELTISLCLPSITLPLF